MSTSSLPGVRRAFLLVETLARQGDSLSFSQLEEACPGANASTTSRLVQVLVDEGLLTKADGRYQLGPRAKQLGTLLGGTVPAAERLADVLADLAERSGESAAYYELIDGTVRMMAKVEQPGSFHYVPIGHRNQAIVEHGFGRVILAAMPDDQREALLATAKRAQPKLSRALRHELDTIRDQGLLCWRGEGSPNVLRVSAPVYAGAVRRCVGALGVSAFDAGGRDSKEPELRSAVQAAAERAARLLDAPTP